MGSIREYPRDGSMNGRVENSGEVHLPCVVLVDTSGSMSAATAELNKGLVLLGEALREDPQAVGRVEYCIITFDDVARILVPFGPAYDYSAPTVSCDGMTAMHQAVGMALEQLEIRKKQYRDAGTSCRRPWVFMLTDGEPNDADHGEFQALRDAQMGKHCSFFPMGIGTEVNMELLKSLIYGQGFVLTATKENFKDCFVWLSDSLSETSSHGMISEKVSLPNPKSFGLGMEPIELEV